MRYQIDHDFHIHSYLSSCSNDPEQTPARILRYGEENGYHHICLTDHFWDSPAVAGASEWYLPQDFAHVTKSLPLPQGTNTAFHFGCETDMDKTLTVGVARETWEKFEFVIVPTTHMHMRMNVPREATAAERTRLYVARLDALLDKDLPFQKIGVAHLATALVYRGGAWEQVLDGVDDATFTRLFARVAQKGAGVELNADDFCFETKMPEQQKSVLRVFRLARDAGCKFYLGSDAHHPAALDRAPAIFQSAVERLELTEADKFRPFG